MFSVECALLWSVGNKTSPVKMIILAFCGFTFSLLFHNRITHTLNFFSVNKTKPWQDFFNGELISGESGILSYFIWRSAKKNVGWRTELSISRRSLTEKRYWRVRKGKSLLQCLRRFMTNIDVIYLNIL